MSASSNEQLHHPDPAVRSAALDALAADAAPARVAETAARFLADPDPGVRDLAASLLSSSEAPDAAAYVVPLIASDEIAVRNLAGEVLVQLGAPAVPALEPAVDDPDADVRKFAIDVLAQLPARGLAAAIAEHLDDEDGNVRLAAIEALGTLRAADYAEQLYILYEREPLARPNVVTALGTFGRADDLPVLARALDDDDPVVQLAAAEALATHDAPETHALLVERIDTASSVVRPILLQALVDLQERHAEGPLPDHFRTYLLEMLSDADTTYRCAAVRGLATFLDDAVVEALLDAAGSDDEVDLAIFRTLVRHPRSLEHVVEAHEQRGTLPLATAATYVLGLIGQGAVRHEEAYQLASTFLAAHFDALDSDTRLTALSLCRQAAHPAFGFVVRAGLDDPDPAVNALAADAAAAGIDVPASPSVN